MSYNYDINPWDDNYATSQPQQNATADYGSYGQQQPQPVTPYGYDENNNTYGQQTTNYQYQEQQQQQQPQEQLQSNDAQGQTQETNEPQGWLSRLFGRLCPFCCGPKGCRTGLPFVDAIVQSINKDLLISKVFYFFFYSAFGSLFPLMGVYFKQLGMNPAQVGILTGVRPFIEIFSAPFWHSLAERFHKSKALLIFSLISWIVFTYSLAHIRPPASACVAFNDSVYLLYTPYSRNDLSNYDVGGLESIDERNKNAEENPNEVFMSKPPQLSETEGKDAILASEENQNDQRRRRRRKRQAYKFEDDNEHPVESRYAYTVDSKPLNQLHEDESSEFELDSGVELDESLFEKRPSLSLYDKISNPVMPAKLEVEDDNEAEEEEAGESKRPSRFIWARSRRDTKEDDLLGESDEAEQEEEKSTTMKNAKQQKVNKNTEEESEEEQEEQDETDNEVESRRKQSAATTAPPPPTTTAAKMEPEEKTEGSPTGQPAKSRRVYKQRHKTPPTHIVGMSPITVEYAANYNKDKHSHFVTPMFSTIVYKLDDIKEVFFLLLLLISLGEFFSAPALTLADSATLAYLGDNTDLYGRQRLFGSLSWAITLLLVGMALDNATSIADHPCGPHPRERSYTVCFAIFSLLMACALATATQFRFSYAKSNSPPNNQQALIVSSTTDSKTIVTKTLDGNAVDDLYASTQPRSIFNTAPPVNAPTPNATDGPTGRDKFEYLEKWKSAVFAQNTKELPEWVNVFRQFKNPLHLMYLFITWFLGCGVGLVFTFLFWHLQDVGGTPTLFGICSVINHISEILAYFFSFSFIKRFGHTKVLSFGLGCNVIRFLYVAFLTNPYYALPFELVQGITHAACFAACCSYISHISKPELRTSTQGVMQGLHHGIGRACGTIIGGYMINAIGSRASFCIYGLLSGCVLGGFLYLRKKQSETEDEEVKVDDSEALGGYGAPQGVPSAIPVNQSQTQQDIDYQW